MRSGLLGRVLSHSYSPKIHHYFGNKNYTLFEVEPENLEHFFRNSDFTGINVTMPYKKAVIPYLDELTPVAQRLGAVNTIVRRDGKLIGHNTDYDGFLAMVNKSGLSPAGKKCLVLGSGGASNTVTAVLRDLSAEAVIISRTGQDNYENLHRHRDAAVLVNATPVGMYPENGISPVDLALFPHLEYVLDLVYNPARTALMLQAQQRGILAMNGLWMLLSQARAACQWFTAEAISDHQMEQTYRLIQKEMENIVLIGMPGCGKTTVGKRLADVTAREFVDTDQLIMQRTGCFIPQLLQQVGEEKFRRIESEVLAEVGKRSGLVIATGGGCVTRDENHPYLHQNGTIFWLQRDLDKLPTAGRPLSQAMPLSILYQQRKELYAAFADHLIEQNGSIDSAVQSILEVEK